MALSDYASSASAGEVQGHQKWGGENNWARKGFEDDFWNSRWGAATKGAIAGWPVFGVGAIPGAIIGAAAHDDSVPSPMPGESFEEWVARAEKARPGIGEHIMRKSRTDPNGFAKFKAQFAVDPAAAKAQQEADAKAAREAEARQGVDDFVKWANRPMDQMLQDPDVQRMVGSAQNTVRTSDRLAGVEGGLSNANSERAFMDAAMAIENQRKQMGLQAMNTQFNDIHQVNRLAEDARQFDVRGHNEALRNQHAAQTQQYQTIGAVAGTALGFAPALAGPAGMAMLPYTVPAGASIGGGVGGSFAPAPPAYNPRPPSAPGLSSYAGKGY